MLSFVPIYFGIAAAAGEVSVAASSGALLLAAAEVTVQIIAFASVPVASAQLALAVSGSLSEISPAVRLSSALKKAVGYIMTFAFTVFLALLSIQTAINSAADTVTLKTLKFMVGSFVPVAGSALSETVSVLGGSIKILQSGVGVYGIFAVLFTVGPTAAQLIVWRIGLYISRVAAEMLGVPQAAKTVAAVDDTLSLLLGVILFVGALFIIALAVTLR
jgi:stage III sporulation protein AE